jgi:hypothetical protein
LGRVRAPFAVISQTGTPERWANSPTSVEELCGVKNSLLSLSSTIFAR